ncbi:MAG: adenosylmethionine decarboxylase [Wohlfahrtiimonas sp.]
MNTQFHAHGQHVILDLYGINHAQLTDPELIESMMLNVADELNATVLQSHLHHFGEDLGVTGVLLLAESHMSIHTWPEAGFAAIDIFMCGDKNMDQAIQLFIQAFAPTQHDVKIIQRGKP